MWLWVVSLIMVAEANQIGFNLFDPIDLTDFYSIKVLGYS